MKLVNTKSDLLDLSIFSGGRFYVDNLESAYFFCEKIATSHYENFPVGSLIIPKKFRKYFYSVYAFSRIADDIADELVSESTEFKINVLNSYSDCLLNIKGFSLQKGNPIFVALYDTIENKKLPISTLQKLITAFKMDAAFKQAKVFDELLDYCQFSANPVGELVLRIFDMYNSETAKLSDNICTGLQLINFWQDLSVDLKNDRCFIPENLLLKYDLTKENLELEEKNINFKSCISVILNNTMQIYKNGRSLPKLLKPWRLKFEIAITFESGMVILKKCEKLGTKLIKIRPKLFWYDYLNILLRAFTKIVFYGSNNTNRIS